MVLSIVIVSEAATRGALCEKVFLEISQNSQENTCARASFLIKLQASASYFHMKTTILVGFQMCISVPLNDGETF